MADGAKITAATTTTTTTTTTTEFVFDYSERWHCP